MIRLSKLLAMSLCLLCTHFTYAVANDGSSAPSYSPKECPKPCPPKPCPPKACPPKPCKPCPPVCFERGYPDTKCCIASAYNEPADYELSPCPWDLWLDASFTYWTVYQEGMALAQLDATYTGAPVGVQQDKPVLFQDTAWKPGFKVGLGMDFDHDHWSGYAEYTWFRSTTRTSANPPSVPQGVTNPVWNVASWSLSDNDRASSLSSDWRVRMDLLDAALTRPYYQGTHLIIAPFGGVRAAWIRQNLDIRPTIFPVTTTTNRDVHYRGKSSSWAVGPRAGFQGEWHLGCGFRFEGDVAASIVFTRYTTVSLSADPHILASAGGRVQFPSYSNYDTIRYNNDMNVGIGWGDYFDCRNYHFDLLLTYDFQIFWNQNMIREIADSTWTSVAGTAGNLYLQGITLRAQFDF